MGRLEELPSAVRGVNWQWPRLALPVSPFLTAIPGIHPAFYNPLESHVCCLPKRLVCLNTTRPTEKLCIAPVQKTEGSHSILASATGHTVRNTLCW